MRIANIMLGRGLGGIEQAFYDYTAGLVAQGHEVSAITHPKAAINERIASLNISHVSLPNLGQWDPSAPARLRTLLKTLRAEIVLCHGGRSIQFSRKAGEGLLPVVAVAHNYQFKHLEGVDAVFAITQHMIPSIVDAVMTPDRVYHVPNMIEIKGGFIRPLWQHPPRIGAMGRMVEKKGFDVWLRALAILKERDIPFRGILAGAGEEKRKLKQLAGELGIRDDVSFPGWVDDPMEFMKTIDLFCVPSHHEPFGIVLLEAMASKLPIVTTDAEGPGEIIRNGIDGLMVPRGDAAALANALARLLADEDHARTLASDAYFSVKSRFARDRVCQQITDILEGVQARWWAEHAPDAEGTMASQVA